MYKVSNKEQFILIDSLYIFIDVILNFFFSLDGRYRIK